MNASELAKDNQDLRNANTKLVRLILEESGHDKAWIENYIKKPLAEVAREDDPAVQSELSNQIRSLRKEVADATKTRVDALEQLEGFKGQNAALVTEREKLQATVVELQEKIEAAAVSTESMAEEDASVSAASADTPKELEE